MTLSNKPVSAVRHGNLDQDLVDKKYMRLAIQLARQAEKQGEVPIGALIVDKSGKVLAKSGNLREKLNTTLGHAELVVIHRACTKLKSWRLIDCTLYVSLEPCYMCSGALVQARISRVVYGASDPKGGALGSLDNLHQHEKLNHKFQVTQGVLQEKCSALLKEFFKRKRKK